MNRNFVSSSIALAAILITSAWVSAADIVVQEKTMQEPITKDVAVRNADNVMFLVDSSGSMAMPYKNTGKSKYELSKEALKGWNERMPDIGYKAGLYSLIPWSEPYPMQGYNRAMFGNAINQMPPRAAGRTPLVSGLDRLEGVMRAAPGKTIAYVFSDGGYDDPDGHGLKDPGDKAAELARRYDVCFVIVDLSETSQDMKHVRDMANANNCSRRIPLDAFLANPESALSPLYTMKSETTYANRSEEVVKGLNVNNIHFDFDQSAVSSSGVDELAQVGQFLQSHPTAIATVRGFTDSIGAEQYNLELSHRRSEAVASYLESSFKIDSTRLKEDWYGEAEPLATNDTREGRALNRRVEVLISGL